jgi:ABC-2 type transport system ATP-binding protein
MSDHIVLVDRLTKKYGTHLAVDNVSFSVGRGEIFALLGPNGAGKTSTLECVEGLRNPDDGQIRVAGLDPTISGRRLAMGVQLQAQGLPSSTSSRVPSSTGSSSS